MHNAIQCESTTRDVATHTCRCLSLSGNVTGCTFALGGNVPRHVVHYNSLDTYVTSCSTSAIDTLPPYLAQLCDLFGRMCCGKVFDEANAVDIERYNAKALS